MLDNSYAPEFKKEATPMSKALGAISYQQSFGLTGNMKYSSNDKKYIQKIIEISESNKSMYSNCILQSLSYDDCLNIIGADFKLGIDNPSCCVPPVIIALFINKMQVIDDRFINSNLAKVIADRYAGKGPKYKVDFEFFSSLTNDPNDLICDGTNIYKDLLRRCELQEMIRKIVWNLRNGKFYDCEYENFIHTIDRCKMTRFDSPHLIYVRDEGTILRRLFTAFSYRPIQVASRPVFGVSGVDPRTVSSVTPLAMIEVKIPVQVVDNMTISKEKINLKDGLSHTQWYIENGNLVPKAQEIINCQDVVVFYVNRRINSNDYSKPPAGTLTSLPMTPAGAEKINSHKVDVDTEISIANKDYKLNSVIVCNVENYENNGEICEVITGSSTIFLRWGNSSGFINEPEYYWYDGVNANNASSKIDQYRTLMKPISKIHPESSDDQSANFKDLASKYGTIFIYSIKKDDICDRDPKTGACKK